MGKINVDHLGWRLASKYWLQVWRKDGNDGISWDELQVMKNIVFGEDAVAFEIYPPQSEVVNIKNVRHLWIFDQINWPNLKKIFKNV
jgi:hypothetical protein